MRFCTTHRACESYPASRACEVGIHLEADHDALPNCTLVDALIVTKEDGEWPKWWLDALWEWVGKLNENVADALERAKP